MYLWLAVTSDEYELPIAVEKTARELAERLGTTAKNIQASVKYNTSGKNNNRKFLKIIVEED